MHKSNKTKTGLEEVLINILNNTASAVALYLKGFEADEIAKMLSININELRDKIKTFEEDQ
ncbi:hypothetical protein [Bacillus rugosus]|uniref:Uncharacterized protein n=1 Tax=Bacillus rugosus TaxID=2715209 RepID=A0ACD4A0M2_9BACI|nr:hypothetical protein [Bacillus rugosus]UPV79799.1 hypothetical protein M0696_03425 [Bacillus rugosus]